MVIDVFQLSIDELRAQKLAPCSRDKNRGPFDFTVALAQNCIITFHAHHLLHRQGLLRIVLLAIEALLVVHLKSI